MMFSEELAANSASKQICEEGILGFKSVCSNSATKVESHPLSTLTL